MSELARQRRADRMGEHRTAYDKNRKRILMSQDICAICGKLVDKSLKSTDPMSANVDHIVSIAKGGHPSSIDNLQLTHKICNQQKGAKKMGEIQTEIKEEPLAWSFDWYNMG